MFNEFIKDAEDAINGLRQLRNATDDAESLEVLQKTKEVIEKMKTKMEKREEELCEHHVMIIDDVFDIWTLMHREGFYNAAVSDAIDFMQQISNDDIPFLRTLCDEINIFCLRRGIRKGNTHLH
jgi:hypothetical protein